MQEQRLRRRHSDYLDFELEVGIGEGRDYPVAVLDSPAGETRATMHFPLGDLALENRLLALQNALLRSGGEQRRDTSREQRAVQHFGRELFDTLFMPDVRSCYEVSLREAAQQGKGLRLKLRIHPPELAALPWEYLWHPGCGEYVSLSTRTPIVRYLELPQRIHPLTVTPPLRILGMISGPSNLPRLDTEREKQRVERALDDLSSRGLVELTWLPGQGWRDLMRAMREYTWHVFHFIGHGGFDRKNGEGLIVLTDRDGRAAHFSATRLGRLLADHDGLRLVLLNSCEGARGSERDIFSCTASILVRRGIPAVLAMQYEITDHAAIEFARTFYEAVSDGMPVDGAVAEGRKAISFAVNNTVEWGAPVLYMRSADGVLFDVAQAEYRKSLPASVPEVQTEVSEELAARLEELYLDGLAAFWLEEWDKAVRFLQAAVDEAPDYRDGDAATKLEQAKRQEKLEALYVEAQTARAAEDWAGMLTALTELVAQDPGYKDSAALLELARRQRQLAELYAQAHQLYAAEQWHAVVRISDQIAALEPNCADPDDLLATARREAAELDRQAELGELHRRALLEMDAGRWKQAQQLLTRVEDMEPGYRQANRLLATVQSQLDRLETLDQQARVAYDSQELSEAQATPQALLAEGAGYRDAAALQGLRPDGLPDMNWCNVSAGSFLMGSDRARDPDAIRFEFPQHRVSLPAYLISKYPVTNVQYAAFVAAGGYSERRYWTVAGWQWKGKRSGPECYGHTSDLSDHPAVGVSWYEAVAFCRWFTERLCEAGDLEAGVEVRLPTEAEWEKAARGTDGRIYPWGNDFDPQKCNMRDTGIGTISAVGSFPSGASPYGVEDLSGNVREWCGTKWQDDYQKPADESPEGTAPRVLRGGSFSDYQKHVRCAVRYREDPGLRDWDGGFRAVVAPVPSGL